MGLVFQIYDARGLLVKKGRASLAIGSNISLMEISELPSGFYTIFIPQILGGDFSLRFMKIGE